MRDAAGRWLRFLRERHGLAHVLLVLAFALAQGGAARSLGASPSWTVLARTVLACQAFFLLLRLCDEEKDLEEDRAHRPSRPLARGLLSLREAHAGQALSWVLFPVLLLDADRTESAGWLGLALLWTFLMRREFFAGAWLRPRLTRYALAHTLVMVPWGMACTTFLGAASRQALPWAVALWLAFNFFEFSRKTFHPSEELPGVDSYTARFGPAAAVGLSTLQVVGTAALIACRATDLSPWVPALLCAGAWTAAAWTWVALRGPRLAMRLRALSGPVLLSFLVSALLEGWGGFR